VEFLQRTPFLRLLLPFIIGILLYQYVEFLHGVLYGLFCITFVLFLLSYGFHTPKRQFQFRWLFGSGVFVFMLSLAYSLCVENEKSSVFDHLNQKGIYRIEIISPPVEKIKSYQCTVNLLGSFDSSWKPSHGKAILYIQKDKPASKLLFGDRLLVETEFATPEKAMNPDGFDYAAYLHRQGIGATCYIPSGKWQLTDRNNSFSIRRTSDKCRNYLLDVYRRFHIQGDEFAVLAAVTLGYTNDLQPDLRSGFAAAGVMHILALSGLHIGIVYVVIAFLLGFLNKTQRQKVIKSLIIMLFLWGFAFLTGLSTSVIRATLMFSFITIASCFRRKSQIYNTLFMSMLVMLLVNPNYLYDVGYQLSYAAVLSIIFFKPVLDKIYNPTNNFTKFAWNTFSVSLVAQIGTTPFTLYYFQQFPNYFLITNIVAVPMATLIIYLAMGLLFSSFVPYIPVWIGFLLNRTVWLLNYVMSSIQKIPYSVSHISLDIRQSFVLFLAIFCFSAYYLNRKIVPLMIGLASVLLTCVFNIQVNYHTLTTKRMIVYAGMKNTHISFINGNKNYVFTTDSLEIKKIAKTFWQNQKLETPEYLHNNNWFNDGFACFEDSKILILTQNYLNKQNSSAPIELDYLIIGNHLKPKMEQILQCVHPRKIIIDNSISKWYTENIKQFCISRKIKYYSLAEKGAYIQYIKD